ncbi:MAG: glycosyltransferase family 4 protein, partial [Ferruginibacter sp.]
MKILILYTYNKGLLSSFFQELSEKLHRDGFDVVNFYLKHKSECFNQQGVHIQGEKRGNYFQNYFYIYKIIKQTKPDVVISNFSYVNPSLLFGKLLGVKHNIVWFHTLKSQMNFKASSIYIKSKFMNLASTIITNSKELKWEVINAYQQNHEKVHNIPFTTSIAFSGIKEIKLNKLRGKIYIGCPGRLHPDKNQSLIIDVLSELKDKNMILVLAGSNQSNFLELHKPYHTLKNQVVYLGNLSREEMLDFYHKMDVIILPSLNEAFGLVLIEALASGCQTLVSSRFGALDYIKEDVSSIT